MPDVELISSSFGGGWAIPHSDWGRECLEDYFAEGPAETPAGQGYIIEPNEVEDLADYLKHVGVKS